MNISELLAVSSWKKHEARSIEPVLKKALEIIDDETRAEIEKFILSRQHADGGFIGRAGKSDVYYSLFGHYVAQALGVDDVIAPLKEYVRRLACNDQLSGVDLYCSAILYASLVGRDAITRKWTKMIRAVINQPDPGQVEYTYFMIALSLMRLEDFGGVRKVLKKIRGHETLSEKPCPVIAAEEVLRFLVNGDQPGLPSRIMEFYRGNGGFAALHDAPGEDLLSTAVALFALQFMNADLGMIKPDCLLYIDKLYDRGGFRATVHDETTDTEYAFYGLLALGSLAL